MKIGILGGGQLGLMLIKAAKKMNVNLQIFVLDPDPKASCCDLGVDGKLVVGDFLNYDDVLAFGLQVDVLTIEFENVNVDALEELQKRDVAVYPQPEVIKLIQDKGLQKQFLQKNEVPTAPFILVGEEISEIQKSTDLPVGFEVVGYPFFQKMRRGGYDGKGVQKIANEGDLVKLWRVPSVFEKALAIKGEIGVVAARSAANEVMVYDPVEMVFDEELNVLSYLVVPARFSVEVQMQAVELAKSLLVKLNIVGVLAVEMFVLSDDTVVVNEMAPRVHNSGHHTIDACVTSQFEQHLRAIMGLPLKSGDLKISELLKSYKNFVFSGDGEVVVAGESYKNFEGSVVMMNLLGDDDFTGRVKYFGVDEALDIDGVYIHLYNKFLTKPFRKMGHFTVIDETFEKAMAKAQNVRKLIKIQS